MNCTHISLDRRPEVVIVGGGRLKVVMCMQTHQNWISGKHMHDCCIGDWSIRVLILLMLYSRSAEGL